MDVQYWVRNDLRTFVDSVIATYEFIDYGIVTEAGNSMVTVALSTYSVSRYAKTLPRKIDGVRLLYPSSSSFSIRWSVAVGDRVLLLATRNYIKNLDSTTPIAGGANHFDVENLLAYPVSSFNEGAMVAMDIANGNIELAVKDKLSITAKGDITIKTDGKVQIESTGECTVKASKATVQGSAGKLEIK